MSDKTKKTMTQVSVSIREDKFEFLKAWASDRDESMATICRGWIYTGLADLEEALHAQGMLSRFQPDTEDVELAEVEIPQDEPLKERTEDERNLENPNIH